MERGIVGSLDWCTKGWCAVVVCGWRYRAVWMKGTILLRIAAAVHVMIREEESLDGYSSCFGIQVL